MKKLSQISWGLAFIAVGVLLILKFTGVVDIDFFFNGWWTLFLIVPSVIGLFDREGRGGSAVVLVVGISLLLAAQGVIEYNMVWKIILGAVLVVIGLGFIFKDIFDAKVRKEIHEARARNKKAAKDGECKEYSAIFSGQKVKFDKEEVTDFEATAVFGGLELDLRKAVLKKDLVIDVVAFFGGIDIFVPSDVVVKTTSHSFCGGIANKAILDDTKKGKTIYINATTGFGGVEIK